MKYKSLIPAISGFIILMYPIPLKSAAIVPIDFQDNTGIFRAKLVATLSKTARNPSATEEKDLEIAYETLLSKAASPYQKARIKRRIEKTTLLIEEYLLKIPNYNVWNQLKTEFTFKNLLQFSVWFIANAYLLYHYLADSKYYPSTSAIAGGTTVPVLTNVFFIGKTYREVKNDTDARINKVWKDTLLNPNFRTYLSERLALDFVESNKDHSLITIIENLKPVLENVGSQRIVELSDVVDYILKNYVPILRTLRTNPEARSKVEIIETLHNDKHFRSRTEELSDGRLRAIFTHNRITPLEISLIHDPDNRGETFQPRAKELEKFLKELQVYINIISNNFTHVHPNNEPSHAESFRYLNTSNEEWKKLNIKEKSRHKKNQ